MSELACVKGVLSNETRTSSAPSMAASIIVTLGITSPASAASTGVQPTTPAPVVRPYTSPNTCRNDLSNSFKMCFKVYGNGLHVDTLSGSIENLLNYGPLNGYCYFTLPGGHHYGNYNFSLNAKPDVFVEVQHPQIDVPAGTASWVCVTHFSQSVVYQDIHR